MNNAQLPSTQLVSEMVVCQLLEPLMNLGDHLICDNFFSEERMVSYLLTKGTTYTGIIRAARGVPGIIRTLIVPQFSTTFCRKGDILVTRFVDNKTMVEKMYLSFPAS